MADTSHFGRLAGTAIVVIGVAGAFLYWGGWLNSEALTPGRFSDGFERADGIYSGFRFNHAKGVASAAPSRATAGARAFQRP
jgi:catalase